MWQELAATPQGQGGPAEGPGHGTTLCIQDTWGLKTHVHPEPVNVAYLEMESLQMTLS